MCAPKAPSVPKVNPYAHTAQDPRYREAARALGINNINKDSEFEKVEEYILQQDIETAQKNDWFKRAVKQLENEGHFSNVKTYNRRQIDQIIARQEEIKYKQDTKKQNKQMQKQYDEMMEEMNKPLPTPQQAMLPKVQAKQQEIEPMPQAKMAPIVQRADAPPPPVMVNTGEANMPSVRTNSRSTRSSQKRASGTGGLRIPNRSRSSGLNIPRR